MNIFEQMKSGNTNAKTESKPVDNPSKSGGGGNDSGGTTHKTVSLKPINFAGAAKSKPVSESAANAGGEAKPNPSSDAGSGGADKPKVGGLNFGQSNNASAGGSTAGVGPASTSPVPVPVGGDSTAAGKVGISPLAAFASQSVEGVRSESKAVETLDSDSSLAGHVPSEPPPRLAPEDMSPQQKSFVDSLNALYSVADDAQLFSAVVSTLMSEMSENPDLVGLMAPEDHHTMISGMRAKAGMARIVKTAAKAKRGAAKKKTTAKVDDALQLLQGLM